MTWSLPATAATVTSLRRAGTGAFVVQVPCCVPCACAAAPQAPSAAQTHASLTTLRTPIRIVSLPLVFCRLCVGPLNLRSYPTLQLAQRDVPDYQHARVAIVKARDGHEILAAIALEHIGVLDPDLLPGLETIGRKARRDHGPVLDAALGEPLDAVDGR